MTQKVRQGLSWEELWQPVIAPLLQLGISETERIESEVVVGLDLSSLSHSTLRLIYIRQHLPNSTTCRRPSVQTSEPMGDISHRALHDTIIIINIISDSRLFISNE